MKKLDQKRLDRAAQLAAAFVANGDIRLSGNTREDSTAMAMLGDLLASLYAKLTAVEADL